MSIKSRLLTFTVYLNVTVVQILLEHNLLV